jgi:cysteine desulfurase
VAALLGRRPGELVFTSGGTEADNLAVLGGGSAGAAGAVACTAADHHAVLEPVESVGGTVVGVDAMGRADAAALAGADLVSVLLANNETGVINDLAAVRSAIGDDAVLHTDAVAAARWLDLAVAAAPADMVSISGHKLGAPVGIGALVVGGRARIAARQLGGGQERERRSGTVDVAGAVGLATALRLAAAERAEVVARVGALRDRLIESARSAVPELVSTVEGAERVAGTAHVCVPGVDSEALLFLLDEDGVCASAASSCASGAQQASHVLAAMGVPPAIGRGSLRFSLGPTTTEADVDRAVRALTAAAEKLR